MTLYDRIDRLRLVACLSRRELCRLAGLNPTFLSRARTDVSSVPRADLVVALARVLGATADWIVGGHGECPTDEMVMSAVTLARHARATKTRPAA